MSKSAASQGSTHYDLKVDDYGTAIGAQHLTVGGINYSLTSSGYRGPEVKGDGVGTNPGDLITFVPAGEGTTRYVYRPTSPWNTFYGES